MRIKDDAERRAMDQQNRVADIVAQQELSDLAEFGHKLTGAITAYRDYRKRKTSKLAWLLPIPMVCLKTL